MKYHPECERFAEAYVIMAEKVCYRPGAPGDGLGTVALTQGQVDDPERLQLEALAYGRSLSKHIDKNSGRISIGVPNWVTNKAFFYTVEAARLLCCGTADRSAFLCLELAISELKESGRKDRDSGRLVDLL